MSKALASVFHCACNSMSSRLPVGSFSKLNYRHWRLTTATRLSLGITTLKRKSPCLILHSLPELSTHSLTLPRYSKCGFQTKSALQIIFRDHKRENNTYFKEF